MSATLTERFSIAKILIVAPAFYLIAAAILKSYQVLFMPEYTIVYEISRIASLGMICLELAIGLWLVSNVYRKAAVITSLSLFTLFAIVAATKWYQGQTDCGCFGPLEIAPVWTTLLDVLAVCCLTIAYFGEPPAFSARLCRFCLAGYAGFVASLTFLGIFVASPTTDEFGFSEIGNVVVVDPSGWPQKRFSLINSVWRGDELRSGEWTVVLHRHDCEKCETVIQEHLVSAKANRTMFIQVPPVVLTGRVSTNNLVWSHVKEKDRRWLIRTPLEIHLKQGVVVDIHQ